MNIFVIKCKICLDFKWYFIIFALVKIIKLQFDHGAMMHLEIINRDLDYTLQRKIGKRDDIVVFYGIFVYCEQKTSQIKFIFSAKRRYGKFQCCLKQFYSYRFLPQNMKSKNGIFNSILSKINIEEACSDTRLFFYFLLILTNYFIIDMITKRKKYAIYMTQIQPKMYFL